MQRKSFHSSSPIDTKRFFLEKCNNIKKIIVLFLFSFLSSSSCSLFLYYIHILYFSFLFSVFSFGKNLSSFFFLPPCDKQIKANRFLYRFHACAHLFVFIWNVQTSINRGTKKSPQTNYVNIWMTSTKKRYKDLRNQDQHKLSLSTDAIRRREKKCLLRTFSTMTFDFIIKIRISIVME